MGLLKTGASAISKLFIVVALAGAFLIGLVCVVYLSLQGKEVAVPEIVGKNYNDGEKELSELGLKIKKRAFRYSQEKPNTVIEQSPRAGEPVKTGQIIFVVVSQENPEGSEAPAVVNKEKEDIPVTDDDIDAPKKPKNSNVKKPATTSRDGAANKPTKNSNSNSSSGNTAVNTLRNSNSSTTTQNPANRATPANRTITTPTSSPKPGATKTPTGGDVRSRRIP